MAGLVNVLTIRRPDDWHLHLRDGAALASVVKFTAARFGRAIVMPNLKPPVATAAAATAYRERVLAALPDASTFTPLMTLYLTDSTTPEEIDRALAARCVYGVKLYPAGATTHSDAGVTDIRKTYGVLERMEACGMPLLVHGEAARPEVDVFDRESVFIDETLAPLIERFPRLKVVFEHITTARATEFVAAARERVAATITPQHLLHDRNAIFAGGIRPHYYCLRAARSLDQRDLLRLRRNVHGTCGDRALCGGVRRERPPRSAGGFRESLRGGFLRAAASRGAHHLEARAVGRA
jgi:dihydroorotase